MPEIVFHDQPCGNGKTSRTIAGLDPLKRYIIVVPFLSEVERWKADAKIPLEVAPEGGNKSDWLRRNVEEGNSVVCTHALFDLLDLSRTDLSEYEVIIDEVFDCVEAIHGVREETFEAVYLGEGYATVDPANGRVSPTAKWTALSQEAAKLTLSDVLVRRAALMGFHRAMASKVPPPGRDGKGRTTTRG